MPPGLVGISRFPYDARMGNTAPTCFDFTLPALDGSDLDLSAYRGKVLLLVNVASQCGYTPQYEGMEHLWRTLRDRGLVVVGSPCNQFGNQEPGTDREIASFCETRYQVSFPMSAKVEVNGPDAHPLWQWLQREKPGVLGTTAIKWNFTKFLVDRDGHVVDRYAPAMTPTAITGKIEQLLGSPPSAIGT